MVEIDPLILTGIIGGIGIGFFILYSKMKQKPKYQRPDVLKKVEQDFLETMDNNPPVNFDWLYHGSKLIGKVQGEGYFKRHSENERLFIRFSVFRRNILKIFWFNKKIYDIPFEIGKVDSDKRRYVIPPMIFIDKVGKIFHVYSTDPDKTRENIGAIEDAVWKVMSEESYNSMAQGIIDIVPVNPEHAMEIRKKREELELIEAQKRGLLAKA